MNRIVLTGLVTSVVALATACDMGSAPLAHQSSMDVMSRGVALHDADSSFDGAQVGMRGTTCDVDVAFGSIGSDYDYPGDDETVDDVATDDNGDVNVIVTGDKGVHIQQTDGWNTSSRDFEIDGVVVGRNFEDGAIVLAEGDGDDCALHVVGTDNDRVVRLKPDQQCLGVHTLETDPTAGGAWIGSDGGLWSYEGSEVVVVSEAPSNIVAYDPFTDGLYTAELGGTVVTAFEPDGSIRWQSDVGASIYSLADLGAEEAVAVSVNYDSGTGGVLFLDGWTGEQRAEEPVSTPNNRVVTSRDGRRLAIVSNDRVDFYDVNPGLSGSSWDWGDFGSDTEWDWSL